VFSTVLLQMEVPDRFRGRVFAAELALVSVTASLSSYWTGYALDRVGWSPRTLSWLLGVLFCIPGTMWMLILSRWTAPHVDEPPAPAGASTLGREEAFETRIG
jgi:hypothetical protein